MRRFFLIPIIVVSIPGFLKADRVSLNSSKKNLAITANDLLRSVKIESDSVEVNKKKPLYGSFGFDTSGMDKSVRPGDDFYSYANGNWQKTFQLSADQSVYSGTFSKLYDLSLKRTMQILGEAQADHQSKIGNFYRSFMDEAAADKKGLAPLKPLINQINSVKNKNDLAGLAAKFQREGVQTIFKLPGPLSQPVFPDDKHPKKEIFHLLQGGLGLPDRDYYLKEDPILAQARSAYVAYMTRIFILIGEKEAGPRALAVMTFEHKIAELHWTTIDSRDVYKTYNRWKQSDFITKAPGFDWNRYLNEMGLSKETFINVAQPGAFTGEAHIWGATPLDVLKDFLLIHLLDQYAPYLSKPFVDARFVFRGTVLTGVTQNSTREKRGIDLVTMQMRDAIGQIYVSKYFPPQTRAAAKELVKMIISAWRERLKTVEWMDVATRAKTREKLENFVPLIGNTAHWRNYSTLQIDSKDLVGNVRRAYAFEYRHQLKKLRSPTIRDDWGMTPMRADANAVPVMNVIEIPAAILQPPMFDPNADLAVNYGAIGSFIGHEISHLFDDQGRKYDQKGALSAWWTPEDVVKFSDLTHKLVLQYDAYQPIPGQHIQGGLTLGENMADLAGITVSHLAYHMALAGKTPPVLDGFTGEQRFYLGWAQIWRVKYRPDALKQQLLSDPHPPGPQRVFEVRNRDDWYKAFNVKPGDNLYLPENERIKVW